MEFIMPPVMTNASGEIRKVGFELEFGALELDAVAAIIMQLYGGKLIRHSSFLQEVQDTSIGNFYLKMDSRILTEKSYEKILDNFGINAQSEGMEDFVESVASIIIPYEIGTPPLPLDRIHELEKLRQALFENEAKGTRRSIFTAYATHVNAEVPKSDAETLTSYLKAFLLLYPWMFERSKIYFTRRISNFIEPFPDEYSQLVLQPGYNPDLETLIEDYHLHNPDRNRPLDMYPVFAFLMPEKIKSYEDIGNVKPRPTFHYRLPNSEIDKADWCLADEWNTWVRVEFLASKPEAIQTLCREYLVKEKNTFINFNRKWIERMDQWLNAEFQQT